MKVNIKTCFNDNFNNMKTDMKACFNDGVSNMKVGYRDWLLN